MEKEAYRQHFVLEEKFWWFSGRRRVIQSLLTSLKNGKGTSDAKRPSILDVGCGTGGMFQFFQTVGDVWGLDLSSEALFYCRKRNQVGRIIQGSVLKLPFSEEKFDFVAACDLFYHRSVQDDVAALRELYRVCRKEGHLLLTDSAFNFLKSPHDHFFHGIRRYTVKELKSKIEGSGFSIERISYMNMMLFPFIYLWRKLRRNTGSDLRPIPRLLNCFLASLFAGEAQFLKYCNLPWGSSIICLAKKKG